MNKIGLNFFEVKNVSKLNLECNSFSNFFLKEPDFIDYETYGKHWLSKISKYNSKKKLKVKIYSESSKMDYYFYITVTKIKNLNQYLLSLNNITELEKNNKNILKQANIDVLTTLYNRTKMLDIFNEVIHNAHKYNEIFSVILFDIDFFKAINDNYGHNIGDKVLTELSRLAKSFLGADDYIGRWGGEEFFIILKNKRGEEAKNIAIDMKNNIFKYKFNVISSLSCSFGVTEFKHSDTQLIILERVDKALYKVKNRGRNDVELIV